jgi:hypothetical protein
MRIGMTIGRLAAAILTAACLASVAAYAADLPFYLKDRGPGIPTSMFGTYIEKGQFILYPFYEYYYDNNYEYKPSELGFGLDQDFRGHYRESEVQGFFAYGLTNNLAIEAEVAWTSASLYKSPGDPSSMPAKLHEQGQGDIQTQLTWRWLTESEHRPMLFSFLEVDIPHHRTSRPLTGTPEWEFKLATGVSRGFRWGTLSARVGIAHAGSTTDLGEFAVEYLKRISKTIRVYVGLEAATLDELELIAEIQIHLSPHLFIKLNNAFGLTPKATDLAPEIGLMFSFPTR